MKFQFDPNLDFQREAIDSIVSLFEGQGVRGQVLQCHIFYSLRLCSAGEKSTPRSGKPSTSARNRRNRWLNLVGGSP